METRVLAKLEISPSALSSLSDYVRVYYLTPNKSFKNIISRENRDGHEFEFDVPLSEIGGAASTQSVHAKLSLTVTGVSASFDLPAVQDSRVEQICDKVSDGVGLAVSAFTAKSKKTSVYFVFSSGPGAPMEAPGQGQRGMGRQILKKLFRGNTMNMFLILLAFGFLLVLIIGDAAIFAIIGLQAVLLFFSDRLGMNMGEVHPTADNPGVSVVSVRTTPETAEILKKWGKALLPRIKEHVMAAAASEGDTVKTIQEAIKSFKIPCEEGDVKVVKRDVYSIVKAVADKFHMPVPKISIANTPLDNASATGVSPRRSSITITAGAIEDLDDSQLQAVVGHELGHVKGRDPIILFCTTAFMYIGGLYLWLPLLLLLGVLYFFLAFGVIYSVGKLLETRADTESAAVLGEPMELAAALTSIGYSRLYYEKYSAGLRVFDWFNFDPHPPTYFRVQRLYRIADGKEKIAHTFLVSVRDCVSGFARAVVGQA